MEQLPSYRGKEQGAHGHCVTWWDTKPNKSEGFSLEMSPTQQHNRATQSSQVMSLLANYNTMVSL